MIAVNLIMAEFMMCCHFQVESYYDGWWEPILASVIEFERKYMIGIQVGRIQDACHHQVKWEWMSLSQIELVWVSIRVEWECFWVNLREDNKDVWIQDGSVSIQHGRIQHGCQHQVESYWMSGVFLCKCWEPILASVSDFQRTYYDGWIQDGQIQESGIQDACHHQVKWEWMSLSQIELVWVRARVEWECFWGNLREDNRMSQFKIAVSQSNMAEFMMAIIIKLSQYEWVKFFLCKWWEPILASVSEFERKYYDGWIQDGQIPDGRIQDGCHHQVKWEWMSLSQIELVWISIRVEWEYFWVNLREDNKVSESKMAVSKSNMAEFKMAIIIKLSQNEWVKFFCANGGNQSWQVWVSLRGNTIMAESKMAKFKMVEFKMAAIIKFSENEWAWVRLN